MTISNMSPIFGYISTTDAKAIHTLHVVYSSQITDSTGESSVTEVRDFYIKNLSHDANRAQETAQELCLLCDIPLKSIDDFNSDKIVTVANISKIDRAMQDQIVHDQWSQVESEHESLFQQAIERNVFIVGQYSGKTASEVYEIDPDHVKAIAKQHISGDNSKFQVNAKLAKDFINSRGFIGNIGDTVTCDVTLTSRHCHDFRKYINILWRFLTKDDKIITFFSVSKEFYDLELGDVITISGVVKDHKNYDGTDCTVLSKPKLVK